MTKFNATLKRGSTYTVRGIKFEQDIPRPVDEDLKEYLEEFAVDHVGTQDGETIERQKFIFEELEEDEAPTTRKRTRKAAE